MKTPTHVEFQHVDGTVHVAPRDGIYLMHSPGDKEWLVYEVDGDCCDISPETAARLRRELLGEEEAEAAPPPESKPLVVTGPGVYRDAKGWGRRIVGPDVNGMLFEEGPDEEVGCCLFWNNGHEPYDEAPALVERVADLHTWNLPDAYCATPAELAAMLAASKPAAEPEFVPVGWHVLAMDGVVLSAEPFATRVAAEEASAMWGQCRVVKLYVRREDARP